MKKNSEKMYLKKISQLTDRNCLVEVKKGVKTWGLYGVRFNRMPYNMKSEKISEKMYRFVYDETATLDWTNFRFYCDKDMTDHYFALFKLNDTEYLSYDFTDDSDYENYKKVFTQRNQGHSQVTGFVKQARVHVSKYDFYLLTGFTDKDWKTQRQKITGGLVLDLDVSENHCKVSYYYEPSSKKYTKIPKSPKGIGCKSGKYQTSTSSLNLYLPQAFTSKGNVETGQVLIDTLDITKSGQTKLSFEALPRTCSCCGKPIFWNDEVCSSGYACESCDDKFSNVREIISSAVTDDSDYRLLKTIKTLEERKAKVKARYEALAVKG